MGGSDIPDEEKCVIILKQLPADTPASMAMAFEKYRTYEDLKEKISKQVQFPSEFKGSHSLRVNMLATEPQTEDGTKLTELDGNTAAAPALTLLTSRVWSRTHNQRS